jgi:hypothetical protein
VVEKDLRRGGKKLHGILRRSPEEQHQREKELAEEK